MNVRAEPTNSTRRPWQTGIEQVRTGGGGRESLPIAACLPAITAHATVTLRADTFGLVAEARASLARLDSALAAVDHPADPAVLLNLVDALASSRIEQVRADAAGAMHARLIGASGYREDSFLRGKIDDESVLVAALLEATSTLINAMLEGPAIVVGGPLKAAQASLLSKVDPRSVGIRSTLAWIGGPSSSPHCASFVAPVASRIPAALDDLERFCNRADVDPLVAAALAHAQFETIHPFPDGNGRTGRSLFQALLRAQEATHLINVPTSVLLAAETRTYYAALTEFRGGDLDPIVDLFARSVLVGCDLADGLLTRLASLQSAWRDSIHARSGAAVWRAIPIVVEQPVISINYLAHRLGVAFPTATRAVKGLEDAGVLTPLTQSRRNRIWVAHEVCTALDTSSWWSRYRRH